MSLINLTIKLVECLIQLSLIKFKLKKQDQGNKRGGCTVYLGNFRVDLVVLKMIKELHEGKHALVSVQGILLNLLFWHKERCLLNRHGGNQAILQLKNVVTQIKLVANPCIRWRRGAHNRVCLHVMTNGVDQCLTSARHTCGPVEKSYWEISAPRLLSARYCEDRYRRGTGFSDKQKKQTKKRGQTFIWLDYYVQCQKLYPLHKNTSACKARLSMIAYTTLPRTLMFLILITH